MSTRIQNGKFTDVILDSLGEGLFTVDKDFRIQTLNRAAEKILGLNREKIIGDFCKNIFKKGGMCLKKYFLIVALSVVALLTVAMPENLSKPG